MNLNHIPNDIIAKAKNIRFLVLDVDGILTDGSLYFDDKGNETKTDYMKMMKIVKDAGYRGWVAIEYEGGRINQFDGIKMTKKLLEKCRDELA